MSRVVASNNLKAATEYGKGNVIFLDGSSNGMTKTMDQIMGMMQMKRNEGH